ncbi:MAG: FHA domain-containing protein, partial [Gemmatimonadales bacterium]
LRCTKCGASFSVQAGAATLTEAAAPAGRPPLAGATIVSKKGLGLQLPPDKRVALSATGGPLKGTVFTLSKPRVVLGRIDADIVVDDPEVSRKHCAVEVYGLTGLLVDLGSTNGTFVNDSKVETHKLEHLTEFRIGDTTLMFTVTSKS